jgi:hypothetical protein
MKLKFNYYHNKNTIIINNLNIIKLKFNYYHNKNTIIINNLNS